MLKSLHIGRYVTQAEDLRALAGFLEAVGFRKVAGGDQRSAIFSAPVGLLSVNALPAEYPQQVLDHLKDVNRLIVLEVTNPDDVFEIAKKKKLKVLADSASPKTGERSFSLALPGDIIVTVHGKPEELPAGREGNLKAAGKRFAIVVSRFNAFITERLLQGALDGLRRTGARNEDIEIMRVPGSFELPSAAGLMKSGGGRSTCSASSARATDAASSTNEASAPWMATRRQSGLTMKSSQCDGSQHISAASADHRLNAVTTRS